MRDERRPSRAAGCRGRRGGLTRDRIMELLIRPPIPSMDSFVTERKPVSTQIFITGSADIDVFEQYLLKLEALLWIPMLSVVVTLPRCRLR